MEGYKNLKHISEEELAAFLDGTLKGQEREKVLSHLIECKECRAVVMNAAIELNKKKEFKDEKSSFFRNGKKVLLAIAASLLLLITPFTLKKSSPDISNIHVEESKEIKVEFHKEQSWFQTLQNWIKKKIEILLQEVSK